MTPTLEAATACRSSLQLTTRRTAIGSGALRPMAAAAPAGETRDAQMTSTSTLALPFTWHRTRRRAGASCALLLIVMATALGAAEPAVDLLADARWEFSADEGKTFSASAPTFPFGGKHTAVARTEFNVTDPAAFVALELTNDLIPSLQKNFFLNDREVLPLQPVMLYNRYPAVDPTLLRPGRNVLVARVIVDTRRREVTFRPKFGLLGLKADHLRFESGPVLGAFGPDWFSVTCRTNLRVPVRLVETGAGGGERVVASSGPGIFHRFKVARATVAGASFALVAGDAGLRAAFAAPGAATVRPGQPVRFAVVSDSQSVVPEWTQVSRAVHAARPQFVIHCGDMVSVGRDDDSWEPEFFTPARALLAAVPFYPVHGNHEGQAPVVEELFHTPGTDGKARNWVQDFGDVTVVGFDQWIHQDWEPGSENVRWLERTLAGDDSKFLFVMTHYPAFSSCSHGKVDEAGVPIEKEIRRARQVIVPLLEKHRVTAMVNGHDHYYERSELPGGLIQIITGGAGDSRDGQRAEARRQNPYSKVHAKGQHYSLIEVNGDACTLRAITPTGAILDTVNFKPRVLPPKR